MQAEESRLLNEIRDEIRALKAQMREQLQQDRLADQSIKVRLTLSLSPAKL